MLSQVVFQILYLILFKYSFIFYSDGIIVKDDQRHIISEGNSGACYLVMTSITVEDKGQYMCYAANTMGNASTLAKITVDGKYLNTIDQKCNSPNVFL